MVFACYKFYDYIYGKPVAIETDHQPLVTIHNKSFHTVPARLQRMMLRLQKFNLTFIYKKGKHLHLADTLSRAPRLNISPQKEEQHEFEVMAVQLFSPQRLEELRKHTAEDQILQTLSHFIQNGWPRHSCIIPAQVRPFFDFCDELCVENNIIMRGCRAVIPASLHFEYLKTLHKGHPGIECTKRRARESVFWLSLNEDIETTIQACSICNSLKPHQQKEPLKLHAIPTCHGLLLLQTYLNGTTNIILCLLTHTHTWFEIDQLNSLSSLGVINKLKRHFSTHGIPQKLYSDNGTQFKSQTFCDFSRSWNFLHVTSSPEYPRSNGRSERAVRSAKKLLETTN